MKLVMSMATVGLSALIFLPSSTVHAGEKTKSESNALMSDSKTASAGLPRIGVKEGKFVIKNTENPFTPRGFQYIRIDDKGIHYVFRKGAYDKQAAEQMFERLSRNGFNLVRVFVGLDGVANEDNLDPEFMANFIDFLERAERHGVYIIPVKNWVPPCARYAPLIKAAESEYGPALSDPHAMRYLSKSMVEAKCLYLSDFVKVIRDANPRLLTTIFAYELENESELHVNKPPFSLGQGTFTPANGKTYNLGSDKDLQEMLDENAIRWANACVEAIRSVDKDAMVSNSVFVYRAVGRRGPASQLVAPQSHHRVPLRPLALAESNLSYLDIHIYSRDVPSIEKDLASSEFEPLKKRCAERGIPLFVGEIGAIREKFPKLEDAVKSMPVFLKHLKKRGFQGYCYWTYDCIEQTPLWHALSGEGEIFRALKNTP